MQVKITWDALKAGSHNVSFANAGSRWSETVTTDASGHFVTSWIPDNRYHIDNIGSVFYTIQIPTNANNAALQTVAGNILTTNNNSQWTVAIPFPPKAGATVAPTAMAIDYIGWQNKLNTYLSGSALHFQINTNTQDPAYVLTIRFKVGTRTITATASPNIRGQILFTVNLPRTTGTLSIVSITGPLNTDGSGGTHTFAERPSPPTQTIS